MGLDMYLEKDIYIGANYAHNKVLGTIHIFRDGEQVPVDLAKVTTITELAGYWRKANQIHNWFVEEVQKGKDECQRSHVELDQLRQLRMRCLEALETKNSSLLPPRQGFFFGSDEIDEYYWKDLQDTVMIIDSVIDNHTINDLYYYEASW